MTHETPFSAVNRGAQIEELLRQDPVQGNFLDSIFGPTIAGRRERTARRASASSLLDKERASQQLREFQAAIQKNQADGLPLSAAINKALAENPQLLLNDALFKNVETFRRGFQPQETTLGRGDRRISREPGTGDVSTVVPSEARPLVSGAAGSQLQDPTTGARVGPQVPFKPNVPPADVRMVNAIQAARRDGDEGRVKLLTEALLKDNTTALQKNVAEVFRLEAKADELRKTPGKEREADALDAQAKLLKETVKGNANFLAEFFGGIAQTLGGGGVEPPPGPVVPLAGSAPQAGPPPAPVGLTGTDQQILALPLEEINRRQLAALLSRPAGVEALRQKVAQARLQAVPGGGPTVPGTTSGIAPGPALGGPGAP